MKKKGVLALLLGALLWVLWQPPIPQSGFFYAICDGDQIWRVQRFFRSSPVAGARLRSVEDNVPIFSAWAAITARHALEGEPTGLCLFDDDGDFSGFLPLTEEVAEDLETVGVEGSNLVLTFSGDGGRRGTVLPFEDAHISWPAKGCGLIRKIVPGWEW